jgi:hypothetical protein
VLERWRAATITGMRNGAGFPNRCSKLRSEFGLILLDLRDQHSLGDFIFAAIVHQTRTNQIWRTVLSC